MEYYEATKILGKYLPNNRWKRSTLVLVLAETSLLLLLLLLTAFDVFTSFLVSSNPNPFALSQSVAACRIGAHDSA